MSEFGGEFGGNGGGASVERERGHGSEGLGGMESLSAWREEIDALDARTREAVKARPMMAVGVALAVGYALGRMLTRRY